ncbi:helix-turn-helix transcriptional regulator [Kineosporia sp. NBRC 101731]|uniref:helix-turn-helix transcriptional regulator n=1 Tax=Kineosporia sp. NBRC 101731 TaxID=3032199 RepID=UPI0024A20B2E|nr:helix-turn-helix transcriptional regulator [Kineosporia sp. NBRC 101731]GLY32564.1 hypothetical protein Kisp02_59290 [Kineosporia sp. NBRC 101731]
MRNDDDQLWARVNGPGDLGVFLREVRERAELTQEELAESIGADRKYVHQVETGQGTLYTTRLFALLRELGLHFEVRAP